MYKSFLPGIFVFLTIVPSAAFGQITQEDSSISHERKPLVSVPIQGLQIGGYLQTQWLHAQAPGIASYSGGNFPVGTDNRFSIRRGRLGANYELKDASGYSKVQVTLQVDASENGVAIRDAWASWHESKWHVLSLTVGMFQKPFGYEVTYSSSRRESPERGRASQILMRGERDLGVKLSLSAEKKSSKLKGFHADLALMNGPGISAHGDYDSHKDVIARVWSSPRSLFHNSLRLSGGISWYEGGIVNRTATVYRYDEGSGFFETASGNEGLLMHRRYAGADAQIIMQREKFQTEIRAEYLRGQQTGSVASSETPLDIDPPLVLATRHFEAGYFYLLQQLGSTQSQLVLKYDFYDPNRAANGLAIDASKGYTSADIRFQTWGFGYVWDYSDAVRLMLYYDHPINERTRVPGYTEELSDDVFTARLQFRF
ncbi:MAG: porin [Bacteroidetes bacterium]|nr:porin [Bacteroidota bacterium]